MRAWLRKAQARRTLFGVEARLQLGARLPEPPVHSREAVEQELATRGFLETQIESAEHRLETIMKVSVEADLLKTLPCVGKILSRLARECCCRFWVCMAMLLMKKTGRPRSSGA